MNLKRLLTILFIIALSTALAAAGNFVFLLSQKLSDQQNRQEQMSEQIDLVNKSLDRIQRQMDDLGAYNKSIVDDMGTLRQGQDETKGHLEDAKVQIERHDQQIKQQAQEFKRLSMETEDRAKEWISESLRTMSSMEEALKKLHQQVQDMEQGPIARMDMELRTVKEDHAMVKKTMEDNIIPQIRKRIDELKDQVKTLQEEVAAIMVNNLK